jgi:N-acetylglucosaminyl-diphospho-decaprenol L-rhamnosyltransferase
MKWSARNTLPIMPTVDAVIVAYNSRAHLRACVEPLSKAPGVRVIVVDNASPDRSLEVVEDLDVVRVVCPSNGGFAKGCNAGWRVGDSRYVLFLNPDARLADGALRVLVEALDRDPELGVVGPRIVDAEGVLVHSQRRFLAVVGVWAQACFLHRLLPRASWTDGIVRNPAAYDRPGSPDWISGACMLIRRDILERLDGFDQRFFMYCEDQDLCLRVRAHGFRIGFEPEATALHEGGASAPRAALFHVLVASRISYARKNLGRRSVALVRLGLVLGELTHVIATRGGVRDRIGHLRALRRAVELRGNSPSQLALPPQFEMPSTARKAASPGALRSSRGGSASAT